MPFEVGYLNTAPEKNKTHTRRQTNFKSALNQRNSLHAKVEYVM